MSLIDRTLDPLPRRTSRSGRTPKNTPGWFSSATAHRARFFMDVSWARLVAPSLIGLALLIFIQLAGWSGNLALLIEISAVMLVCIGIYAPCARLTGLLRHSD